MRIKFIVASALCFLFFPMMVSKGYAADNPYDSAQGISGSSHRAAEAAEGPFDYQNLNSSGERARRDASTGFDIPRDSNLGWGTQYIPIPKPKIEKE